MNNSFNTVKFTLKRYVILKKDPKIVNNYTDNLEEKIVELSLRLKGKNKELEDAIELNNLTFKKLIHNLKNPVGVAFSFSEMILEGLPNYTPDKLERHIEIIKNSSEFSLNLLNSFAEFHRYQSTDLKLYFATQNFSKVLLEILENFKKKANEKGISIQTHLPKNDIEYNFDKTELTKAISNVLDNAIRYSPENTAIQISVFENKNEINVIIADQGIGIEENHLPFIFNDFFVVNTYSNDTKKCIGLGLPITKRILAMHNGTITTESQIGKGSIFTITLPKES